MIEEIDLMDQLDKIIQCDCLDGMRDLPEGCIDMVVTSPPYDDQRTYHGYQLSLMDVGREVFRVLKPSGVAVMVMQDRTKNWSKTGTTFRTIVEWMDMGFGLFEVCIYQRQGVPGAWWKQRFQVNHEYILIFVKGRKPAHFDKSHMMVRNNNYGHIKGGTKRKRNGSCDAFCVTERPMKCCGTVMPYSSSSQETHKFSRIGQLKLQHPATFPDRLAEDFIRCFSKEGDIVLDPFMGSGTTARMARKHGRRWLGFEVSPEYIALANSLLSNEVKESTDAQKPETPLPLSRLSQSL